MGRHATLGLNWPRHQKTNIAQEGVLRRLHGKPRDRKSLKLTGIITNGPFATAKGAKQGDTRDRGERRLSTTIAQLSSFTTAASVNVESLGLRQWFTNSKQGGTAFVDPTEVLINTLHGEELSETPRTNGTRSNFHVVGRNAMLPTTVAVPSRRTDRHIPTLVAEESFFSRRWRWGKSESRTVTTAKSIETSEVMVHTIAHSSVSLREQVLTRSPVKVALEKIPNCELHPKPKVIMGARGGVQQLGMRAQPKKIRANESVERTINLNSKINQCNKRSGPLEEETAEETQACNGNLGGKIKALNFTENYLIRNALE